MARLTKKEDRVFSGGGVEISLSSDYSALEQQSMQKLRAMLEPYPKAQRFMELLLADPEMCANWDMADYITVGKLHFNDHGEVHHKIVATAAVSILQLLIDGGVAPDIVTSGCGDHDDAFLAVMAAAFCHDIGNQVHRDGHPSMSVVLAVPLLDRLLPQVYADLEQQVEVRAFILHAIRTHDTDLRPLTVEASLVAVADACDMTKGRARYVFEVGAISIHTVGALAVERIEIGAGQQKPVRISVELSNSAGIFPIEEYLVPKVNAGALAEQIEVVAGTAPRQANTDLRILYSVQMEGKRFVAVQQGADDPASAGLPPRTGPKGEC